MKLLSKIFSTTEAMWHNHSDPPEIGRKECRFFFRVRKIKTRVIDKIFQ